MADLGFPWHQLFKADPSSRAGENHFPGQAASSTQYEPCRETGTPSGECGVCECVGQSENLTSEAFMSQLSPT